jgi:hypothetical protein
LRLIVYIPLLLPLLVARAAWPLAGNLNPRTATWLLTGCALALAVASSTVLGLLALAGLIRIPLVAHLGHWSLKVVHREDPTEIWINVAAAGAVAVLAVAVVRMVWRRGRALLAAAAEARCLPGRGELVVLDDETAEAFAIPGRPGRIVVSTGMLTALTGPEREVLLAHERAHLICRHHLFVAVAQLAATANPLLRPLAAAVSYTVERWADEQAAWASGDRRLAARTIGKAALASAGNRSRGRVTAVAVTLAVTGRRAELAEAGPIPRRVAALLTPAPAVTRSRGVLVLAVIAIAAVTGLCAVEAAHDLHELLHLARGPRS